MFTFNVFLLNYMELSFFFTHIVLYCIDGSAELALLSFFDRSL